MMPGELPGATRPSLVTLPCSVRLPRTAPPLLISNEFAEIVLLPRIVPPDQTFSVLATDAVAPESTTSTPVPPGLTVPPPMNRLLLLQFEPIPVMVAVPLEVPLSPTNPLLFVTCPPLEMVSEPTPFLPIVS